MVHIAKGSTRIAPQMQSLLCLFQSSHDGGQCNWEEMLLRALEKWLWVLLRAPRCPGERRGKIDPEGCVSMTTATSSDPCLLINRRAWLEPVKITQVLHVMLMTPQEAQHHSTPF